MSDKRAWRLLLSVVCFLNISSRSFADKVKISNVLPSGVQIAGVLQQYGRNCGSVDCQTLWTIYKVGDIMNQAHETPMKVAAIGAAGRARVARDIAPARINKLLRSTLFDYPEYYHAICSRTISLTRNYDESDPGASDETFVLQLIEIAELIDTRTHGRCLPDMLAPLPHTPQVAEIVSSARGDCENSQWHNPGCRRIRRPETVK